MSLQAQPLSPTDGYVFVKGIEPHQITEHTETEIREAVAKLYAGGLDRRLIDLPPSGRLPLIKGGKDNAPGGSRVTYRIRVERPQPEPKARLRHLTRAERRQLSHEARRATA